MHKDIKIQIAVGLIILLAMLFGASFSVISNSVNAEPIFVGVSKRKVQKICTQEARECPDGTFVGRTGPKCEFVNCPSNANESCVGEGDSIGAVYPGVVAKKCCAGMKPIIPKGIEGTQGICQKIKK